SLISSHFGAVTTFCTALKARLRRARPGRCPAQVVCKDAEISRGDRELERRRTARAERAAGRRAYSGAAASRAQRGGSPPGAALPPVGCSAPAGRRHPLQRTPVTAPARAGRAVVLTPN